MDVVSNQSLQRQVPHPYSKDLIVTQEIVTNDGLTSQKVAELGSAAP